MQVLVFRDCQIDEYEIRLQQQVALTEKSDKKAAQLKQELDAYLSGRLAHAHTPHWHTRLVRIAATVAGGVVTAVIITDRVGMRHLLGGIHRVVCKPVPGALAFRALFH